MATITQSDGNSSPRRERIANLRDIEEIFCINFKHIFRNYDQDKTFERMMKAGVFMSIRPDGTFRRYMKRKKIGTIIFT